MEQQDAMDSAGSAIGSGVIDELAYRSNLTGMYNDLNSKISNQVTTRQYWDKENAFIGMCFYVPTSSNSSAETYRQFAITELVTTSASSTATKTQYPLVKTRMSTYTSSAGLVTFKCGIWFYGASIVGAYDSSNSTFEDLPMYNYYVGTTGDVYFVLSDALANALQLENTPLVNTGSTDTWLKGYGSYAVNGNSNGEQREKTGVTAGIINTTTMYSNVYNKKTDAHNNGLTTNKYVMHIHSSEVNFNTYFDSTPNSPDTTKTPITNTPWILDFTFTIDSKFNQVNTDFA